MSYLEKVCLFFQTFILAVTPVIAQPTDVLPMLKPSYTHDLLQGKQGIKVDCISDVFPDSQGRLWLQTCGQTLVKELRFVQYDGYRFDHVTTHDPQYHQDYGLWAYGVSPHDQLYGKYQHAKTGEVGIFFLALDSREIKLHKFGDKKNNFITIFDVVPIADSTYLLTLLVDDEIQVHTLSGDRKQMYKMAEDVHFTAEYIPKWRGLLMDQPTETWFMRETLPLVRIDKATRSVRKYQLPDFSQRPDVDAYLYERSLLKPAYMVNGKNDIVYLYFGYHLYQLDKAQDRFVSILSQFPSTYTPLGIFQDNQGKFCFVFEDEAGKLQAILQDTDGNRFNYSAFFTYFSSATLNNVVSEDFFREVYVCGQGGLLHMYVQEPTAIQNVLDGYFISSMMEIPTGEFLINTVLDGWFILSQDLRQVRPFSETLGCAPNPFTDDPSMVQQIIPDKQGNYWWLKEEFLYQYHPVSGICNSYDISKPGQRDPALFGVLGDGKFVFGNWSNDLLFFDLKTGQEFIPGGAVPSQLSDNIWDFHVDPAGIVWIPTTTGLWKIDWENKTGIQLGTESGFAEDHIQSIYQDESGKLWLGTFFNGLQIYDPQTGEAQLPITAEQGLADNSVVTIFPDAQGDIWVCTEEGITLISQAGEIISSIYVNDGLNDNSFYRFDPFLASDGRLFVGNQKGLNVIDPVAVKALFAQQQNKRKIYLTELTYFDPESRQEVSWETHLNQITEVKLSAARRNLKVSFALSSYVEPHKNHYAYRLAGIETEWNYLGAQHELNLSNLPPGQYSLQIKGSDFRNNWSENIVEIPIYAKEYFYKTVWFYLLCTLPFLLFGLAWAIRTRREKKILEATVAQRTQKIREDNQLIQAQAEHLKELDHLKSRFFANISHEFRTPLTLVMGQIDNLWSEETKESKKKKLSMAHRNAAQLQRLINQLLDLSKVESGKMTLKASRQNIIPLIRHLTSSFESMAEQKNIGLRFESIREKIMVYVEPDKVEKIMYNLLSNALKFTPAQGQVLVKVNKDAPPEEGDLKITVRDSGVGIPSDRLPHIFDRFYQVDSSQTREFEGTGIGLALTKELVQLHGGGISVESTEGFGTTFTVTLPLGRKHLKPEKIIASTEDWLEVENLPDLTLNPLSAWEAPTSDRSDGQTPTDKEIILIVDDNADMRTYIREGLEKHYSILEATNGEDGFAKAKESIPDLIITDVMMPKVDGYALTSNIRQEAVTSHIPIIMVTAKATEEDKFEGLEKGVDAYLTKPFNKQELQLRVRKLIEMRKRLRQQAGTKAVLKPSEIEVSSMDQQFLEQIQQLIEENLENEAFSVDELSREVGMGNRQLQRKLKALTDSSPQQCIRSMRLGRARQLLEQGAGTVSEICFQVGYGNLSAFTRAFREEFGTAPKAILQNRED